MTSTGMLDLWRPLFFAVAIARIASAQVSTVARVAGTVRDTSGRPIAMARLTTGRALAVTDSGGRFALAGLAGGRTAVTVRRLGYAPLDTTLALESGRTDSLHVILALLPQDLPGITVDVDEVLRTRLPDYYRHRTTGGGYYFDRRDVEAKHPQFLSDLLRAVPGLHMSPDRTGRSTLRNSRNVGTCPPDVWIDGIRAEGMNVDDVGVHDIEALEVYRGPSGLPPELNDRLGHPACGSIVIWTRLP